MGAKDVVRAIGAGLQEAGRGGMQLRNQLREEGMEEERIRKEDAWRTLQGKLQKAEIALKASQAEWDAEMDVTRLAQDRAIHLDNLEGKVFDRMLDDARHLTTLEMQASMQARAIRANKDLQTSMIQMRDDANRNMAILTGIIRMRENGVALQSELLLKLGELNGFTLTGDEEADLKTQANINRTKRELEEMISRGVQGLNKLGGQPDPQSTPVDPSDPNFVGPPQTTPEGNAAAAKLQAGMQPPADPRSTFQKIAPTLPIAMHN